MSNILVEKRFMVGMALLILTALIYKYEINPIILGTVSGLLCIFECISLYSNIHNNPRKKLSLFLLALYGTAGSKYMVYWYINDKSNALVILLTVTLSDVLQYYSGRYMGKTKIGYPSPNKTLEGYVLGSISAVLLSSYMFNINIYIASRLVFFGILGDLFVSRNKRILRIKDISCILGSQDRKSTRLNSSHPSRSRMPSSA